MRDDDEGSPMASADDVRTGGDEDDAMLTMAVAPLPAMVAPSMVQWSMA